MKKYKNLKNIKIEKYKNQKYKNRKICKNHKI